MDARIAMICAVAALSLTLTLADPATLRLGEAVVNEFGQGYVVAAAPPSAASACAAAAAVAPHAQLRPIAGSLVLAAMTANDRGGSSHHA